MGSAGSMDFSEEHQLQFAQEARGLGQCPDFFFILSRMTTQPKQTLEDGRFRLGNLFKHKFGVGLVNSRLIQLFPPEEKHLAGLAAFTCLRFFDQKRQF